MKKAFAYDEWENSEDKNIFSHWIWEHTVMKIVMDNAPSGHPHKPCLEPVEEVNLGDAAERIEPLTI